jgi:hypothetical protein
VPARPLSPSMPPRSRRHRRHMGGARQEVHVRCWPHAGSVDRQSRSRAGQVTAPWRHDPAPRALARARKRRRSAPGLSERPLAASPGRYRCGLSWSFVTVTYIPVPEQKNRVSAKATVQSRLLAEAPRLFVPPPGISLPATGVPWPHRSHGEPGPTASHPSRSRENAPFLASEITYHIVNNRERRTKILTLYEGKRPEPVAGWQP